MQAVKLRYKQAWRVGKMSGMDRSLSSLSRRWRWVVLSRLYSKCFDCIDKHEGHWAGNCSEAPSTISLRNDFSQNRWVIFFLHDRQKIPAVVRKQRCGQPWQRPHHDPVLTTSCARWDNASESFLYPRRFWILASDLLVCLWSVAVARTEIWNAVESK